MGRPPPPGLFGRILVAHGVACSWRPGRVPPRGACSFLCSGCSFSPFLDTASPRPRGSEWGPRSTDRPWPSLSLPQATSSCLRLLLPHWGGGPASAHLPQGPWRRQHRDAGGPGVRPLLGEQTAPSPTLHGPQETKGTREGSGQVGRRACEGLNSCGQIPWFHGCIRFLGTR